MPIENADYFVRFIPMPYSVGGFVTPNDDGTYSIYINSRDSAEKQKRTLDHEIAHIIRGDLWLESSEVTVW